MPIGVIKIKPNHRKFAAGVLFLASFACAGFLLHADASATDKVLHLTTTEDRYFLGPYLYYLEDREKNLTISDVSSPQVKVSTAMKLVATITITSTVIGVKTDK